MFFIQDSARGTVYEVNLPKSVDLQILKKIFFGDFITWVSGWWWVGSHR